MIRTVPSANPQGFPLQALETVLSAQLKFVEFERAARQHDVDLAKRDPRANREVRVFDPGVDARYRFFAVKAQGNKKGRPEIRFCWTVNRNAAGRFLVFRETVARKGVRRDRFEAVLDKRAAIAACRIGRDELVAIRAKPKTSARPALQLVDLAEMRSDAMTALSKLSCAAQAHGDPDLMYAANRAWRELDQVHRTPPPPRKT